MTEPKSAASRRDSSRRPAQVAAASALGGCGHPVVHAGEDNTINVALIGLRRRGTGAASNALGLVHRPIKLVAMADVFKEKLDGSLDAISKEHSGKVDVPSIAGSSASTATSRRWDCLRPGDIAILATPPAFRWVQFTRAIERG